MGFLKNLMKSESSVKKLVQFVDYFLIAVIPPIMTTIMNVVQDNVPVGSVYEVFCAASVIGMWGK